MLSVYWLYERTHEPWLLALAAKAHAQGFDWRGNFERFAFTERTKREDCTLATHVVNNAMAVKTAGVWYRQSEDPADWQAICHAIDILDRYHGQVTGLFTGDEHLAGLSPSQGTELCAVVEYMYSLEVLLAILGDPALADRLERIAFNALPATFSPDMWAHQYDQQANQVRLPGRDRARLHDQRPRRQPLRPGAQLRLLHGEPAPGLAQVRRAPLDAVAGRRPWRRSRKAPCELETAIQGKKPHDRGADRVPVPGHGDGGCRSASAARFPLHLRVPEWADGDGGHRRGPDAADDARYAAPNRAAVAGAAGPR